MKTTLLTLVFALLFSVTFAQQATRADDALLLEYYQAQRYQDAADYLKKTFPEPVTDIKILAKLAYTTNMANKLPEAQAYYERIYNIDTTNEGALFSIGNINLRRGNMPKAEVYFKRILLQDTTNFSVYTKLAAIASNKKDTTATLSYLQKANKLNFFDVDVAVDLSTLYMAQKKFDLALAVLNKASESDPDNIYILINMATLTFKEKKWQETVDACKKLISLDAADGQVMYKLGVSYYNLKNYACGAEVLAGMDDRDQTEFSDYYASQCYKGLKDYKSSIVWLNSALKQGITGNASAYYGEIADNNEKMDQSKKAVLAYQKGLQFREDPAIYTALADLYATKLNDKVTAAKYYKMAVASYQKMIPDNGNPMNIYMLANIFDAQLKDTASAIKYYKKFLDAKPSKSQQNFINYTQSRIGQLQNKTTAASSGQHTSQ
ncbi:hypothetical protein HQ865_09620 [Mucilaginibacter mali]|uniref:Tetratricopeptide repeat protein n=1 Tax=Mucilaginibacter mali TaxID=2740462 RepID=A0A7D4PTV3_9SPHI|nr:hypothetical protein [Mucilaginibacter mali]QKJ30003.1 hypothetical protein HQ865_09620 [Mucilaginibacter mali]